MATTSNQTFSTCYRYELFARRGVLAAGLALFALAASGCDDGPAAAQTSSPQATQTNETGPDPLAEVLRLAAANETEAAVELFVNGGPENWIESTSLEDLKMSEDDFAEVSGAERKRLQQTFIDRCGEIKVFARTVVARAKEASANGDSEKANAYVKAVNQLGQQLREADLVLVYRQLGKALAGVSLEN